MMNGRKKRTLDVYEVSIQQPGGPNVKIQAFGTDEIGVKPSIKKCRFERLIKAFNIKAEEVENPVGTIGLLIGLKSQRLMTTKVLLK